MRWKRQHEGWLLIDDRASGGELIEQPTFTCSHCQKVTPLDPLRQQPRGYCTKCDRYLCDSPVCNSPAPDGRCRSVKRRLDRIQEAASRGIPF